MRSNVVAVKIGSNISSLQAQRRLTETSVSLSQVFERLSSGQRINRASDDAAGLALSSSLDTHARIFTVGQRNISDTISAVSISSAALTSLNDISTRQRELATQAASGTFSSKQREALDAEARQLTNEYNRIVSTTEFNGRKLLARPWEDMTTQIGVGSDSSITFKLSDVLSTKLDAGDYFVLDGREDEYVWFTVNGQGSDPAPFTNTYGGIRVDLTTDSEGGIAANTIRSAVSAALTATGRFTVSTGSIEGELFVTSNNTGGSGSSADGNTGIVLVDQLQNGGSRKDYKVGSASTDATSVGDLNGDGYVDIVQSNATSNTVSVLLNLGNGTFSAKTDYAVGTNPQSATQLADLNRDGRLDIVQMNTGSSTASVLLNLGDGTFGTRSDYSAGNTPMDSPTLGDLNGDGFADLVSISRFGTNSLMVRLNDGTGKFGTASSYAQGWEPYGSVALSDVNADGRLDAVYASVNDQGTYVRLNQGSGILGAATLYGAGWSALATPTLSDLNGDGLPDLVQANRGSGIGIAVRLNQGDGTFGARSNYSVLPPQSYNASAILADLNNDGRPDMVQNTGNISVFINQGNGTFSGPSVLNMSAGLGAESSSSVADLNGDGWLDIVQSDRVNGRVSVFMNQRNGTFGTRSDYAVGTTPTGSSTIADVNLDGRPDIVQSNSASGTVSVLTNQGDGTFNSNQAVTRLIFSDSRGMNLINHINLRSQSTARAAMDVLDSRMNRIAQQQGVFGGVESRLAAAQSVVSSAVINYRSANSRIKDTDIAEDSATLVRTQMLQQAGAAVLAQANVQPQIALRLLQGG